MFVTVSTLIELLLNHLWLLFYSLVTAKYASLSLKPFMCREKVKQLYWKDLKSQQTTSHSFDMFVIFCWYNVKILNYFVREFVYYITYFIIFIYSYLYLHCAQDWGLTGAQLDASILSALLNIDLSNVYCFLCWTFEACTKLTSKLLLCACNYYSCTCTNANCF